MRALLLALFLMCSATGCEELPPEYDIVSLSEAPLDGYILSPGNATSVIFVAHQTSGAHAATEAHSLDETIAKVVPTSVERETSVAGQVFIIYGIAPGVADIQVSRDGEDQGTVEVSVGGQGGS